MIEEYAMTEDEDELNKIARKRANPNLYKAFAEWALIIIISFMIHGLGHHICAFIVGWDLTGTYLKFEVPFVKVYWPNAPSMASEPAEWFSILLIGGLAQGLFLTILSKWRTYLIPIALQSYVYAAVESQNLFNELMVPLSILTITAIVVSYIWMQRKIDRHEFAEIKSLYAINIPND